MASEQWNEVASFDIYSGEEVFTLRHSGMGTHIKNGCPKDEHSRGKISLTSAIRLELSVYVQEEEETLQEEEENEEEEQEDEEEEVMVIEDQEDAVV